MENRREFLKKAGVAGGLGAAGALTLKKEYVKPVVRLLEPSAAYAQTPTMNITSAQWNPAIIDFTQIVGTCVPGCSAQSTLVLTLDVPGGSSPQVGNTFDASVSITNVAETGSGWGSNPMVMLMPASTRTYPVINNIGTMGPGGTLQFGLQLGRVGVGVAPLPRLNGQILAPGATGTFAVAVSFLRNGALGDRATFCIQVTADQGVTDGGTAYPAQDLGGFCMDALWS